MGQTIIVFDDGNMIYIIYSPTSLMNDCIALSEDGAFIATLKGNELSVF